MDKENLEYCDKAIDHMQDVFVTESVLEFASQLF